TDLACRKLGVDSSCTTATVPLPGSKSAEKPENVGKSFTFDASRSSQIHRHGDMAAQIANNTPAERSLVCECEDVSVGEVEFALNNLDVNNLVDLRRRTRVGMGTCQGEICACRAASMLARAHNCAERARTDLADFVAERWKGTYPIAWGDTLREAEYTQWVYSGICNINNK
ncbi:MAG: (2Fe-2S)-binding protein, partial [Muribaculaceae bacterium]|nr:(2Fe-2S)-binding protein [Muribaculaceae bacterium]